MFRVNTADFVISAAKPDQFPKALSPEVAFVGRSNVGKSSLLNMLVSRKNLAKTSSTPGKTRQINFFLINGLYHFADLPGYGYAKVSKDEREAWARTIDTYLGDREQLRMVVALSDIRHETPKLDKEVFGWLDDIGRPFLIVLTKYDKVSPGQAKAREEEVTAQTAHYANRFDILSVSSETRHNRDKLLGIIGHALAGTLGK